MFCCLYAFGIPLALTGIVYVIDKTVSVEYNDYKPLIGVRGCWIQQNRIVEAIYIYTPISIIMIVNVVLYSITALKIYKVQRETSVIRKGDSQKHSTIDSDKDRWEKMSFLWLFEFSLDTFVDSFSTFDFLSSWARRGAWSRFHGSLRRITCSTSAIFSIACKVLSSSYCSFGSRKSRSWLFEGEFMKFDFLTATCSMWISIWV